MKTLSLILSVVMLVIFAVVPHSDVMNYALYSNCELVNRLVFSFLHGSWAHILVNLYCFLTLVFMCNANVQKFLLALVCAITIPSFLLSATPIVGLSAINYALTGIVVMNSQKAWWFILLNLLIIGATMVMPGIAFMVHLVCFIEGVVIGFLITPRYVK